MIGGYKEQDCVKLTQADVDELNARATEADKKSAKSIAKGTKKPSRKYKLEELVDGKFVVLKNGAKMGWVREDGKLKFAGIVAGASKDELDRIRALRKKTGAERKHISGRSAQSAFNAYYRQRNYKSAKHRAAAMTRDMNYSPRKEEKIIHDRRYLRNPGKYDYKSSEYPKWSDAGPKKVSANVKGNAARLSKWLEENSRQYSTLSDTEKRAYFQRSYPKAGPEELDALLEDAANNDKFKTKRVLNDDVWRKRKEGSSKKRTKPSSGKGRRFSQQVRTIRPVSEEQKARNKARAQAKRAEKRASQQGGWEESSSSESSSSEEDREDREDREEQHGGSRNVSLKTAVKLLRNYYANRFN
jgi:hypothetical protein